LFSFEGESHAREITEPFGKIRRRINYLRKNAGVNISIYPGNFDPE
jgi:hypothetical protein